MKKILFTLLLCGFACLSLNAQKPLRKPQKTTQSSNAGNANSASRPSKPTSATPSKRPAKSGSSAPRIVATGSIRGHDYVDLGLSVKWATCNVGAEKPSDCGDYFAWGEISPKSEYTEENSLTYNKIMRDTPMDVPPVEAPPVRNKLMSFIFGKSKSRSESKSKPQFNQRDIAGDSRYDAARANWGGSWRLPTKAEIDELLSKCKWEWTTRDGHTGYLVMGPNGKFIFLPAAGWRNRTLQGNVGEGGFYWCSTPDESCMEDAYGLNFDDGNFGRYLDYRSPGRTVRPVSE